MLFIVYIVTCFVYRGCTLAIIVGLYRGFDIVSPLDGVAYFENLHHNRTYGDDHGFRYLNPSSTSGLKPFNLNIN